MAKGGTNNTGNLASDGGTNNSGTYATKGGTNNSGTQVSDGGNTGNSASKGGQIQTGNNNVGGDNISKSYTDSGTKNWNMYKVSTSQDLNSTVTGNRVGAGTTLEHHCSTTGSISLTESGLRRHSDRVQQHRP